MVLAHGKSTRSNAWIPGHAHPENSCPCPAARVWDRAVDQARIGRAVLTEEEGSFYPALQRLLLQGWVKADWKKTETNRRARYDTMTAAARRQLGIEVSEFQKMVAAIGRVLEDTQEAV